MIAEFENLVDFPAGSYHIKTKKWFFTFSRGWVTVSHEKDKTSFMWTSHEDYHSSLDNPPAYVVDIDKNGEMIAFFKTALSLWLIWGYGRGKEDDYQKGLEKAREIQEALKKIIG